MRGTRAEPAEVACEVSSLADRFSVFIDGHRTVFESADAYVAWAGETLQHPLAPNLVARMRIAPCDEPIGIGDDDDDEDVFESAGVTSSLNWGDEDYDDDDD